MTLQHILASCDITQQEPTNIGKKLGQCHGQSKPKMDGKGRDEGNENRIEVIKKLD